MSAFANLEWAQRLNVMTSCSEVGSEFHHRTQDGFRVAVGVGNMGLWCSKWVNTGLSVLACILSL